MPNEKDIRLFGSKAANSAKGRALLLATVELAEKRASAPRKGSAASRDHRHEVGDLSSALRKAVESIPNYVERSTIMLVLVPTVQHSDRAEDVCNFRSWRGRGWCRMEFVCALVARNDLKLIVAQGGAATPYVLFPADAMLIPAGEGVFTCCTRRHDFGRGPNTEPSVWRLI